MIPPKETPKLDLEALEASFIENGNIDARVAALISEARNLRADNFLLQRKVNIALDEYSKLRATPPQGGEPLDAEPMEIPDVNLVPWEQGEKVIAVGGKAMGETVISDHDGYIIRDWLRTAIREIWEDATLSTGKVQGGTDLREAAEYCMEVFRRANAMQGLTLEQCAHGEKLCRAALATPSESTQGKGGEPV